MSKRAVRGQEKGAKPAPETPRPRNRQKTSEDLEAAVLRVTSSGLKLSITAVAAEVGVTPGLIHNTYPDIAEQIRKRVGKSTRQQRDEKAADLAEVKTQLRGLRQQLEVANADIARLASINETLRSELATQKAIASGKVAVLPRQRE
ncbi:MAG: TetR family transcriptional regulator [Burkholderiaceae bacterium]|nr:TetR family transcriptional regulator [Burkholderiaceae bacterium]